MLPLHKTVLLEIAFRTAVIYLFVALGLRLSGKREIGQMSPLDLTVLILVANAVQNAMTGPDVTVLGGIVAALTLFVMNAILIRFLWRHETLRKFVEGSPSILIKDGTMISENLRKQKVTSEEVLQALREHGVEQPAEVAIAVLEIDGSISVIKKNEMPVTDRPHHRIRFLRRNR